MRPSPYSSLFHGICNSMNLKDMTRIINEMVSCRISPNVVTYGILVNGLCKMGNAGMVLGLLGKVVGLIQK